MIPKDQVTNLANDPSPLKAMLCTCRIHIFSTDHQGLRNTTGADIFHLYKNKGERRLSSIEPIWRADIQRVRRRCVSTLKNGHAPKVPNTPLFDRVYQYKIDRQVCSVAGTHERKIPGKEIRVSWACQRKRK